MSIKKILIVCNQSPYPTYHGGAFDMFERLKGISLLGHQVDVVITTKYSLSDIAYNEIKKYANSIYIADRKNKVIDLFSVKPLQYESRNKLKDIVFKEVYDSIILESEFVAAILDNQTLKYKKLVVRVHNNEAQYFNHLAKSTRNIFKKIYYYSDAFKTKQITNRVLEQADRIWYISNKELENSGFIAKSLFMPPPINSPFKMNLNLNKTILFVGSLFMDNNIHGLDWYLKEVHPYLVKKYKDYKLIIAGGTGSVLIEKLKLKYEQQESIDVFFNVKDLDELYNSATIFINPMFFGSGVKLKSINAIVNGLPLVSTDIGAEGIGLEENEMYLRANSVSEFLNSIDIIFNMDIEERVHLVRRAQDYLEEIHYLKTLKNELNAN